MVRGVSAVFGALGVSLACSGTPAAPTHDGHDANAKEAPTAAPPPSGSAPEPPPAAVPDANANTISRR